MLNYRNYNALELNLAPGMLLVEGANGQGKSNLLEALYLMAIAKSQRASADRELVRSDADQSAQAQVSATVQRGTGKVQIQVNLQRLEVATPNSTHQDGLGDPPVVRKRISINGVPRSAADLVGEVNAVMFRAEDLDLISQSPFIRRRYLDILISQVDRNYLRSLQRYQKVVRQRNHLLKSIRDGHSADRELEFWDDEMAVSGGYIIVKRNEIVSVLSGNANQIYRKLTGNAGQLVLEYRPNIPFNLPNSEVEVADVLKAVASTEREIEVARGVTVRGPHRDDLQMLLDGVDVSLYASRGQCRAVVLAMRLSEASYLKKIRMHAPVLLLDDVLSEMDPVHRSYILDTVGQYDQCIITTADRNMVGAKYLSDMTLYLVESGSVQVGGV